MSQITPLINQSTLNTIIAFVENIRKNNNDNPSSLCETGKAYFALVAYYRSADIQEKLMNLNISIDLNHLCQQAIFYFTQAAEKKIGLAYHYLGHLAQNGIAMKEDLQQAFYFYEKAVECGYFLSQHRIAYFYQNGMAVTQDTERAVQFYEKVISASLIPKEKRGSSLGFCRTSVPVNTQVTKNLSAVSKDYMGTQIGNMIIDITKNIENGLIGSLTNLAMMYINGTNKVKGYEYLNQAAKLGSPFAQTSLGNLYHAGKGVKQDYSRAIELYQTASEQNFAPAQICLGNLYLNGHGVEQDDKKAFECFQQASLSNDSNAYVHLGYCFHMGIGTDVNYEKAFIYYQRAANMNHPVAMQNLSVLYSDGLGVEQDRDKAEELKERALQIQAA